MAQHGRTAQSPMGVVGRMNVWQATMTGRNNLSKTAITQCGGTARKAEHWEEKKARIGQPVRGGMSGWTGGAGHGRMDRVERRDRIVR